MLDCTVSLNTGTGIQCKVKELNGADWVNFISDFPYIEKIKLFQAESLRIGAPKQIICIRIKLITGMTH